MNQWNTPTPEQLQITAMRSEMQELKNEKLRLEVNKRQRKKKLSKLEKEKEWVWKKIPPGENEPTHKVVNRRDYHWCTKHQAWTLHKPEECRLKDDHVAHAAEGTKDEDDNDIDENEEYTSYRAVMNSIHE